MLAEGRFARACPAACASPGARWLAVRAARWAPATAHGVDDVLVDVGQAIVEAGWTYAIRGRPLTGGLCGRPHEPSPIPADRGSGHPAGDSRQAARSPVQVGALPGALRTSHPTSPGVG